MKYSVIFDNESIKKKFIKSLHKIENKNIQDAIMNAVMALQEIPRPFGIKASKRLKPPVKLYQLTATYRIRIGDYRVLYDVGDKEKKVYVITLRRRSEKTYK